MVDDMQAWFGISSTPTQGTYKHRIIDKLGTVHGKQKHHRSKLEVLLLKTSLDEKQFHL